jgi:CRISPR/Cas system CSM-associated protein Csm2 small subunit
MPGPYPPSADVPKECIFTTFYTSSGYLRREIFIEAAEKMSRLLTNERMTQSSFRSLFNMLKTVEQRIKKEREEIHDDEVRQTYYKFVEQCDYQVNRRIITHLFAKFARYHLDTVTKNKREFSGFVEYLTAIMARMKTK